MVLLPRGLPTVAVAWHPPTGLLNLSDTAAKQITSNLAVEAVRSCLLYAVMAILTLSRLFLTPCGKDIVMFIASCRKDSKCESTFGLASAFCLEGATLDNHLETCVVTGTVHTWFESFIRICLS